MIQNFSAPLGIYCSLQLLSKSTNTFICYLADRFLDDKNYWAIEGGSKIFHDVGTVA